MQTIETTETAVATSDGRVMVDVAALAGATAFAFIENGMAKVEADEGINSAAPLDAYVAGVTSAVMYLENVANNLAMEHALSLTEEE